MTYELNAPIEKYISKHFTVGIYALFGTGVIYRRMFRNGGHIVKTGTFGTQLKFCDEFPLFQYDF